MVDLMLDWSGQDGRVQTYVMLTTTYVTTLVYREYYIRTRIICELDIRLPWSTILI
jgi:hypothetical protein